METPAATVQTTSHLLLSLKGSELVEFREKQDYKSRLAEYLTGIPLEDKQTLLPRIIADKQKIHAELNFPMVETRVDQPADYRIQLVERANQEGIEVISFKDVPDWVLEKDSWIKKTREGGSLTAGCYSEDLDCIILGDPSSEDPKVLSVFGHELVHAIDYKKMKQTGVQEYTIEELEYRAYLLADMSERQLLRDDGEKALDSLFGDFMISGSCFGYYFGRAVDTGKCKDFNDFCKKAKSGEIHIPWYGARTE